MEEVKNTTPPIFAGALNNKSFVIKFLIFSLVFWILEFAYQFYFLIPGELQGSLVRSFALAGATFIGLALLSSALFIWKPRFAQYWYIRRSLGLMGFVFTIFHVLSVLTFLFQWDVLALFWSINPFVNPLIFGILAIPIFFLMFVTSTDWALMKLGYRTWKTIHRLVYLGYLSMVMHFLTINTELLFNPAGYLLLLITFFALAGEFIFFIQKIVKHQSSRKAIIIGIFIILLWIISLYIIFSQ